MAQPRILLVEDERSIAEPFARMLGREGFVATVAATAAGALEAFDREPPDLVLLDLNLPDGDGRDVARELRSRSRVPIIMLTARGTETDRVVGLEIGADAGDDLGGRERLDDVVVGPDLEPHHPVGLGAAGREHDDRHA